MIIFINNIVSIYTYTTISLSQGDNHSDRHHTHPPLSCRYARSYTH